MSLPPNRSKQWKDWEREVARDLGGKRTGPRGFDVPDVVGLPIEFAPECKYQKRLSLKDADLKQAFEQYGEVVSASIVNDRETNRSKGFGFVTFKNIEDAKRAREEANQTVIDEAKIRVDYSKTEISGNVNTNDWFLSLPIEDQVRILEIYKSNSADDATAE